MEYKCLLCGGGTQQTGPDTYRCIYCGKTFSAADFAPANKSFAMPKSSAPAGGADIFEKCIGGVLEITSVFDDCASAGSGLLISGDGFAVTNTHVVTHSAVPARSVTVKIMGESIPARIVALGDNRGGEGKGVDLALLKLTRVPRNATVLTFGSFDRVRIGEPVYVIGNSLGYGSCITSGIVSDKLRNVGGHDLMMTDCAVNHGNSGGPLFNTKGEVIGVIVSGYDNAEGMNFAIPSVTVQEFLQKCRQITLRGGF